MSVKYLHIYLLLEDLAYFRYRKRQRASSSTAPTTTSHSSSSNVCTATTSSDTRLTLRRILLKSEHWQVSLRKFCGKIPLCKKYVLQSIIPVSNFTFYVYVWWESAESNHPLWFVFEKQKWSSFMSLQKYAFSRTSLSFFVLVGQSESPSK